MVSRVRIDRLLVERGLFASRAQARAAIAAGLVTADKVVVTSPSRCALALLASCQASACRRR